MYLYSDTDSVDNIYGEKATPAHFYESTNDLSTILEDMLRGAVPFNTHYIYPTIWKCDEHLLKIGNDPNAQFYANSSFGFQNPNSWGNK